ncbi:hypothetical protein [Streptomyces sp. NPDC046161]|uniref:hypothetical protein n=1 Tax=Streptomyces sp. NPDC046161 TaxID=3155132 RepID=UPI0033D01703
MPRISCTTGSARSPWSVQASTQAQMVCLGAAEELSSSGRPASAARMPKPLSVRNSLDPK